jgi:hypothetical protein
VAHLERSAKHPMKNTSLTFLGLLIAPICSVLGSDDKAALIANSMSVDKDQVVFASGSASLLADDIKVSADQMIFDQQKKILRSSGETIIQSGGITLKAKDVVIELGDRRILMMPASGFVTIPDDSPLDIRFTAKPNKAPEPTPGSVTPRATEGDSK